MTLYLATPDSEYAAESFWTAFKNTLELGRLHKRHLGSKFVVTETEYTIIKKLPKFSDGPGYAQDAIIFEPLLDTWVDLDDRVAIKLQPNKSLVICMIDTDDDPDDGHAEWLCEAAGLYIKLIGNGDSSSDGMRYVETVLPSFWFLRDMR